MKHLKNILFTPLFVKAIIASSDQALISALNFFISIILIKTVSKMEYGYYSVAFPVSLFLISLQNAIVNTPLAVLLNEKMGETKSKYSASLCYGQYIAIIPLTIAGIIFAIILFLLGIDFNKVSVIAAISFAAIGILFREFFRSFFFADEKTFNVLKLDTIYVIEILICVGILFYFRQINVAFIFTIIGICSFAVGLFYSFRQDWHFDWLSVKESFNENWIYGKWALAGVFITHIESYAYLYIISLMLGSVAVAEVSAARLLLMPIMLLKVGWSRISIPHGSKLRESGRLMKFFKIQIFTSIIFSIGILLYVLFLLVFAEHIQSLFLSEKYSNSFNYVILWGTIFAISFIGLNGINGLIVLKKFNIISKVNFITMVITLVLTYFMTDRYGIRGGLYASIIGSTLLAFILWINFAKIIFIQSKQKLPSMKEEKVNGTFIRIKNFG